MSCIKKVKILKNAFNICFIFLICYLAAQWLIWALVRGPTHSQQILKSFPCYLDLWETLVPLRVNHPLNFWNVADKVIFIFSPFFCGRVYYSSNKGIYSENGNFLTLLNFSVYQTSNEKVHPSPINVCLFLLAEKKNLKVKLLNKIDWRVAVSSNFNLKI